MPRDGSGNYTLPVGNPVVTGTLVTSAWANSTMSDIAVQMNNVLTRDGLLGPVNPFKLVDGAVATPALAFNSEPGLGLYRPAANTINVAAVNAIIASFDGSTAASVVARLFPRSAGASSLILSNQPSGTANRTDLVLQQGASGASLSSVLSGSGTMLPMAYSASKHNFTTDNAATQDHFTITNTGANGANLKFTGNGGTTPSKTIRVLGGTMEWINHAYSAVIASLTDAGVFTANNVGIFSDARLKSDVVTAVGARARLARLRGVVYTLNGLPGRGLIAQEVQDVYPELVYEASNGYLAVNYVGLIGELIQALNEFGVLDRGE